MEQTKKDDLTALQRAKQKYHQKIKHNPEYVESKKKSSKKYYDKIKDDVNFKEKVSIQKRQYYLKKKEKLLKVMVEKSLDF